MSLVNIGLTQLGAEIIQFSSSSDSQLCQPKHILMDQSDYIWNSGEGLPQYLIISLQQVQFKYSHIAAIGFYCWHDYTTNPKTVEIEVAESAQTPFIHWTEISLKLQNGKQFFNIPALPASYRVVKVVISETFGDYETYLNQIMLMAKPADSKANSQMSVNELEYHLKDSFQKSGANSRGREGRLKTKEMVKNREYQHDDISQIKGEEEQYQQNTFNHNRQGAFHSSQQNAYNNRQNYSANKSEKQIQKLQQQQSQNYEEGQEKDESFQKNLALLTLSKKAVEMQENMQQIKRNIQILQLKISVSHENIQKSIMEKVEKMFDKKIQKLKKQLREQIRNSREDRKSREIVDLREVKSQRDRLQFVNSRQLLGKEESNQYVAPTGKSSREPHKSLHIQNLNQTERQRGENKDKVVAGLMNQLAVKLKERELKIKRMQDSAPEVEKTRKSKQQSKYQR